MKKVILVVDDEKNFLKSILEGFEKYKDKYTLLTVSSGKKAVEIIKSNSVDLIISDLKMPEFDGIQLLHFVMEYRPCIPFIIMTAFGSTQIKSEVMRKGVTSYLEKPFTIEKMINEINSIFLNETQNLPFTSIIDIVQLIMLEKKSCSLKVNSIKNIKQKGIIYFLDGKPIYAKTKNLAGEKAAIEMLSLSEIYIEIKNLPELNIEKNINTTLENLIIKALNLKRVKKRY